MQGDSDFKLHSLCISTAQTILNHQGCFYHKSSLPDFHANPSHLMAQLIICNMFCVLSIFTIKNKVTFIEEGKSAFQRAPICHRVEKIEALSLTFLFTLHTLIKVYMKASWSSLGLKFAWIFVVHFICFSEFFFSSLWNVWYRAQINGHMHRLCLCILEEKCICKTLALDSQSSISSWNWTFLKWLCKWIRHLQTQMCRSVQITLFLLPKPSTNFHTHIQIDFFKRFYSQALASQNRVIYFVMEKLWIIAK